MQTTKGDITGVISRGTSWIAATTLVMKGLTFVYIFVVLNYLTVFEYGVAELILTAVPLLSLFTLPGLSATVVADMGRARGEANLSRMKGLLVSFLQLQFLFALFAFVLVFVGGHFLALWYGKGSTTLFFQIIAFSFLLSPLRSSMQTVQNVFLNFRQQSVYSFLEESWKVLLVLLFFYLLHWRVAGLLSAVVLCQLFAIASIAHPLYKISPEFWRVRREHYPVFYFLYHHGKWGVFSNYLGVFGKNIRPWIINFFLGTQAVALFAVVQGLIGHTVSLMPLDEVMAPLYPQFVHERDRLYRLIAKAAKYELLGYCLLGLTAGVTSPWLVAWFFPQYLPAVPLFQLWLVILIPNAFDAILAPVFVAIRAQRSLFFASIYKLVLLVVIMPPCLIFFGLYGIAYASVAIQALYMYERYRKLTKLMPDFKLRWRDFVHLDEEDWLIINRTRSLLRTAR